MTTCATCKQEKCKRSPTRPPPLGVKKSLSYIAAYRNPCRGQGTSVTNKGVACSSTPTHHCVTHQITPRSTAAVTIVLSHECHHKTRKSNMTLPPSCVPESRKTPSRPGDAIGSSPCAPAIGGTTKKDAPCTTGTKQAPRKGGNCVQAPHGGQG